MAGRIGVLWEDLRELSVVLLILLAGAAAYHVAVWVVDGEATRRSWRGLVHAETDGAHGDHGQDVAPVKFEPLAKSRPSAETGIVKVVLLVAVVDDGGGGDGGRLIAATKGRHPDGFRA